MRKTIWAALVSTTLLAAPACAFQQIDDLIIAPDMDADYATFDKDVSKGIDEAVGVILADSYPAIDASCAPQLKEVLTRIALGAPREVQNFLNKGLRQNGCFGPHSEIVAVPMPVPTDLFNKEDFRRLLDGLGGRHAAHTPLVPVPTLRPGRGEFVGVFAYLTLTSFEDEGEWEGVVVDLNDLSLHPPIGILLDLRGNLGGWIDWAERFLDFFSPGEGVPGVTVKKRRTVTLGYQAQARGPLAGTPIVILVDGLSCSSAEMVAAVLRYWYPESVKLVGAWTYGKGTEQSIYRNWNASLGLDVKITTAEFFPGPDTSVKIDGIGLEPDRITAADETKTVAVQMLQQLVHRRAMQIAKAEVTKGLQTQSLAITAAVR